MLYGRSLVVIHLKYKSVPVELIILKVVRPVSIESLLLHADVKLF